MKKTRIAYFKLVLFVLSWILIGILGGGNLLTLIMFAIGLLVLPIYVGITVFFLEEGREREQSFSPLGTKAAGWTAGLAMLMVFVILMKSPLLDKHIGAGKSRSPTQAEIPLERCRTTVSAHVVANSRCSGSSERTCIRREANRLMKSCMADYGYRWPD